MQLPPSALALGKIAFSSLQLHESGLAPRFSVGLSRGAQVASRQRRLRLWGAG
jgi:hypothetical protein